MNSEPDQLWPNEQLILFSTDDDIVFFYLFGLTARFPFRNIKSEPACPCKCKWAIKKAAQTFIPAKPDFFFNSRYAQRIF
jgi:hypothetical protein